MPESTTPCDFYRCDIMASSFGACVCGAHRSQHSAEALKGKDEHALARDRVASLRSNFQRTANHPRQASPPSAAAASSAAVRIQALWRSRRDRSLATTKFLELHALIGRVLSRLGKRPTTIVIGTELLEVGKSGGPGEPVIDDVQRPCADLPANCKTEGRGGGR